MLENADRIGEALTTLRNVFDTDETGVLAQLKNSENELNHIRSHYPAAGEYADRLRSVLEKAERHQQFGRCGRRTARRRSGAAGETLGPPRCADRAQQKHHVADEAGLIDLRDRCAAQLAAIVHSGEEIAEAESALREAAAKLLVLADRLHKTREKGGCGIRKTHPRPSPNWACPTPSSASH